MSPRPESECIPEPELIELFRPRRADPEAFRRGVQRHIDAERAARAADGTPRTNEANDTDDTNEAGRAPGAQAPAWLRRAAALLPGDPLGGALVGSAAGKLAGAKLLPAALALPALLVGAVLGAFAVGARSLGRSARAARPPDPTRFGAARRPPTNSDLQLGSALLGLMHFGALGLMLAAPLLGGAWAIDAIFLGLLGSMAALAISVRGFARAGLLERSGVAALCAGVLASLFLGCFLYMGGFHVPDATSELGLGWSAGAVLLGIPLCLVRVRPRRAVLLALACVPLTIVVNPLACTRSSPAALQGQLAELALALEPGDLSGWSEAAALHRALADTGRELPDLSELERRLADALAAGTDGHPRTWTAALQMGLLGPLARRHLAEQEYVARKLDDLRSGTRSVLLFEHDEYLFWLLRDGELRPEARAALAARLEAGWPEEGKHGALAYALLCVRALDLLGLPERSEALRVRVHRLLVAYWVPRTKIFGIPGGFTSNPAEFRTSFDDHTWFAVQLMARLGVPPEIDARLLRGHLRTESRAVFFDSSPEREAWSRAALVLLEDGIGLPQRGPLQRVLDERLFLAALLIVALSLLAIRLAPSLEPHAGGAQP